MTIADNGYCRMVLGFSGPLSQELLVIHHGLFDLDGSTDDQDLLDLVASAYVALQSPWRAIMGTQFGLQTVQVYERDFAAGRWNNVGTETLGWTGNVSGNALPPQLAIGCSLLTDNPRVTGFSYWPGGMTSQVGTGGLMTGSAQTAAAAAFFNMTGGHVSGTHALVWGVFSTIDGVVHPITGVLVDAAFDTQRRRKPNVGS